MEDLSLIWWQVHTDDIADDTGHNDDTNENAVHVDDDTVPVLHLEEQEVARTFKNSSTSII